jgi:hypothetical protein
VHPEGAHNFVNTGAGETEFYIVYFMPAGASPAAIDVTLGSVRYFLAICIRSRHCHGGRRIPSRNPVRVQAWQPIITAVWTSVSCGARIT